MTEAVFEQTVLEPAAVDEDGLPECMRAECTCPDFCERDHDLD